MITDKNYTNLQGWMVTDMHLTGRELIVYAIIYGLSQDGASQCRIPMQYIAEWTSADERTIRKDIEHLCELGYLSRKDEPGKAPIYTIINPIQFCTTYKNVPPTKMQGVPPTKLYPHPLQNCGGYNNNIIDNIKERENAHTRVEDNIKNNISTHAYTFEEFWSVYPNKNESQKERCAVAWALLSIKEREMAYKRAERYAEQLKSKSKQPYFYISDRYWAQPEYLSGIEVKNAEDAGKKLVQVIVENRGEPCYKIMQYEDALLYGCKIHMYWNFKPGEDEKREYNA